MTDTEKLKIARNALQRIETTAINIHQFVKAGKLELAESLIRVLRERTTNALRRTE